MGQFGLAIVFRVVSLGWESCVLNSWPNMQAVPTLPSGYRSASQEEPVISEMSGS